MKVVNRKTDSYTVYIGRPSPFGNPYVITPYRSRECVIELFENLARSSPQLLECIKALPADAVLGCWCKPLPCHGDVIVKIWKELHGEGEGNAT